MVPPSVQKAIHLMSQGSSYALNRDLVVAYSFLDTLRHHYPSSASEEIQALLERFAWVRQREPSRFLKQRRIALAVLVKEMDCAGQEL